MGSPITDQSRLVKEGQEINDSRGLGAPAPVIWLATTGRVGANPLVYGGTESITW